MSAPLNAPIPYQAHIDGLRGIAVIAVVLFHLGGGLPGGFVGVDVFFVISGFIITLIVSREIEVGTFSLLQFYKRRILRIAPASLTLFAVVGCVGAILLFPNDLKELGQAIIAQLFLCGNIFHMREADYFDVGSEFRPLLHVWSLAVEEQYYIVYPLLLVFVLRWGKRTALFLIGILIVASFVLGHLALETNSRAAFFLLPYRAWELLLGCAVALGKDRLVPSRVGSELLGVVGAGSILVVFFTYDSSVKFPGVNALLPCLGTVAILIANLHRSSVVGRCLSFPPLVYVGLLSYAIYLWHWPVISFARHLFFDPKEVMVGVTLGIISMALAVVSYHLVERPIRRSCRQFSWQSMFIGYVLFSSIVLVVGGLLHIRDGFPQRLSAEVQTLLDTPGITHDPIYDIEAVKKGERILLAEGSSEQAPTIFVYGDSHAAVYFPLLSELGRRYDVTVKSLYQRGTVPFFDGWSPNSVLGGKQAIPYKHAVREALISNPPDAVMLIGRWGVYAGRDFHRNMISDRLSASVGVDEAKQAFKRQLLATLADLQATGAEIAIVGRVSEPHFHVPKALAQSKRVGQWILPSLPNVRSNPKPSNQFVDLTFAELSSPISYIDPNSLLLDEGGKIRIEGSMGANFFDDHHLSPSGAFLMEPLFVPFFEKIADRK